MPSKRFFHVRVFALALAVMTLSGAAAAETQSLETLLAYLKSPNAETRRDERVAWRQANQRADLVE